MSIVMLARPSQLMINSDGHSDVSVPIATNQSASLLWLRPIATDILKNRDLEQIDIFNILHNMIAGD
jgi:hypothetical protein